MRDSVTPIQQPAQAHPAIWSPVLSLSMEQASRMFNVRFAGDYGVGKTAIFERYISDYFGDRGVSTDSQYVGIKVVHVCGETVKLQTWDAWDEYDTIGIRFPRDYYKNADGVLFVFDLSNPVSFENIGKWVDRVASITEGRDIAKILVGSKSDLACAVSEEDVAGYAESLGMDFVRVSAKTGANIDELFSLLAQKCVELHGLESSGSGSASDDVVLQGEETDRRGFC